MRLHLSGPDRRLATDLETERFVLRTLGPLQTLRLTASWRRDPELLAGLFGDGPPVSLVSWLKRGPVPDGRTSFAYAIVPKAGGAPIGMHTIRLRGYRSARNLVGLHDRAWWGKGVVTEVRARLMNHFFAHAAVERFCGSTHSRNAASIFTYRRLGYDHVGTQHRERFDAASGQVVDLLLFEIFRDKWERGPFAERPHDS